MRKSIFLFVLISLLVGRIVAQSPSSLPVMLAVKAVQKTDNQPSNVVLNESEHIFQVNANTLEDHDYAYTKREAMYHFVTRVCGIDAKKFKDEQGHFIEKDVTIEAPDNLLVFGNGSIPNVKYVLQPVKTRPMLPATDIRGAEDLKNALKKLQGLP
jgi:hypothetical protein